MAMHRNLGFSDVISRDSAETLIMQTSRLDERPVSWPDRGFDIYHFDVQISDADSELSQVPSGDQQSFNFEIQTSGCNLDQDQ
jgi:hypothetical protein